MKKILITGGNGQVAYELISCLHDKSAFVALTREQLDITDANAIEAVIQQFKPDAIINAAAYTRVDLAEKEQALAYAVNELGAKNLAIMSAQLQIPFLHISTDYIFDGTATKPYVETQHANPINVYGASKYAGEVAVIQHCPAAMILRVSGVFGAHGLNFVKTILRLAKEKENLRIVADQVICPTPAQAIAQTILRMLLNPHPGVYHYCGDKATNWHAFASLIVEKARAANQILQVKDITAITTADYPTPAKRPAYSVLNCDLLAKTFDIQQPNWEQGLIDVIATLSAS